MSPGKRHAHRIEITLSDERLRALDEARGNEARASFIKRWTDKGIEMETPCALDGPKPRTGMPTATQAYLSSVGPNVSAKPLVKPRPKGGRKR